MNYNGGMLKAGRERKRDLKTPFWGFAVVVATVVVFVLAMDIITIVIRLLMGK